MLTLRKLKLFEAVARLGSYTRAANELGVTQPAVSIQIKHLADELGLPLFDRVGKQLLLSAAGDELLEASQDVLGRLRNMETNLAELKGEVKGTLDVAAVTAATYFAPRLIGAFRQRYPGVSPRLMTGNLQWIIHRLGSRTDDMAIMDYVPDLPQLDARPFLEDRLVAVAPPDHPLAGERSVPLSRLAHEPLLLREPGSTARMTLEGMFRDLGVPIRESMTLGSNEAVKQGVMAGFGLSILSSSEVALEMASGLLTILDVQGFPLERRWYVVHFTDKRLSVPAKTFSAFILSEEGRKTAAESHVADAARPAPRRQRGEDQG